MYQYRITHAYSHEVLGTIEAVDALHALDAYAAATGFALYSDQADIPEGAPFTFDPEADEATGIYTNYEIRTERIECQAVKDRRTLTIALRRAAAPGGVLSHTNCDGSEEQLLSAFSVLQGIVNEYNEGGDQMVELCDCGEHVGLKSGLEPMTEKRSDEVWVVTGPGDHVEVLDSKPEWDWRSVSQRVFHASINGGDSVEH